MNENSEGLRERGSHVRSEADLCDSNLVHVGAVREQGFRRVGRWVGWNPPSERGWIERVEATVLYMPPMIMILDR